MITWVLVATFAVLVTVGVLVELGRRSTDKPSAEGPTPPWLPRDMVVSRAVREVIKTGPLMFSVPTEMIQGQKERVEVRIARSAGLREALISDLRGRGEPQFEEIDTSLYMGVKLSGSAFEITSQSPPEQLIIPTPARWDFDVLPCRSGHQTITLSVNMRVEAEGIVRGRRAVSVLDKQIHIKVSIGFATHGGLCESLLEEVQADGCPE